MAEILQNRIVRIHGDPWTGKTFFACFIAADYGRIYANFEIYDKARPGKTRNGKIASLYEIDKIKYSPNKGIVILDEGGLNVNSRRSSSNENLEAAKLAMLWRKKNVDILMIAQLDYSLDKYFRDLASVNIHMRSWRVGKEKLMFEATIKDRSDEILNIFEVDLMEWSKISGITYDTKERSIFSDSK